MAQVAIADKQKTTTTRMTGDKLYTTAVTCRQRGEGHRNYGYLINSLWWIAYIDGRTFTRVLRKCKTQKLFIRTLELFTKVSTYAYMSVFQSNLICPAFYYEYNNVIYTGPLGAGGYLTLSASLPPYSGCVVVSTAFYPAWLFSFPRSSCPFGCNSIIREPTFSLSPLCW